MVWDGSLGSHTLTATSDASFTYDAAGRLETASNGSDTLTWTYDLAGQILTETSSRNGSTVTSGLRSLWQSNLTVILDGELFSEYAYDDAGRLTTITRGSQVVDLHTTT